MSAGNEDAFQWSDEAVMAAARTICPLASAEPECRCGGACRRVARLVLAAALTAELDATRKGVALAMEGRA